MRIGRCFYLAKEIRISTTTAWSQRRLTGTLSRRESQGEQARVDRSLIGYRDAHFDHNHVVQRHTLISLLTSVQSATQPSQ